MKYIKTYENISEYERIKNSNKDYAFERTFKISEESKIFNIIKALNLKNINFTTYYTKQGNWEYIKIYGLSNKTKTLKKLGFNLFPISYNFTWKWKPINDIETFLSANKYNI